MSFGDAVRLYGIETRFRRKCWPSQTVKILPDAVLWYRRFPQDIGWRWVPNAIDLCAEDWTVA